VRSLFYLAVANRDFSIAGAGSSAGAGAGAGAGALAGAGAGPSAGAVAGPASRHRVMSS
jgi:hypothetical protein